MKAFGKIALGLIGCGVIVVATWPALCRLWSRPRLRFPYLGTTLEQSSYEGLARRPGWSTSSISVASNVQLRGLVRRPTNTAAHWVLYYPGNDETQLKRGQSFLVALAAEKDWGLAVFAYRGYDGSSGKSRYAELAKDAPVILSELCRMERIKESMVHLVGFSIGGHFATIAAGSAAAQGKRSSSLSLLASVNDIVMVNNSRWSRFSGGDDYQTTPLLRGIQTPVLVLQGTADEALKGSSQGRDIAAALGARAQYEEFEGVGHQALLTHGPGLSRLRDFIAKRIQ